MTQGTIRVLRIPVNDSEPIEVIEIEGTLKPLQEAIGGGFIEAVCSHLDWHGYVDEEGRIKGLPPNPRATAFAHATGHRYPVLHGPAIFLGHDEEGNEADVPEVILTTARLMFTEA